MSVGASLPYRLVRVDLPDGDAVALAVTTPPGWIKEVGTVVMVHGLGGNSNSGYMRRIAGKVLREGLRVVCMNSRNAGLGEGLAQGLAHSGRSEDIFAVLRLLTKEAPGSPTTLVGFSLGANTVLKLAGELEDTAHGLFSSVVAVCPPAELEASVHKIRRYPAYEKFLMRKLIQLANVRRRYFPNAHHPPAADKSKSIYEFDEAYTAPLSGFLSAHSYYEASSASRLLGKIQVPTLIISADDDPFVDNSFLDMVRLSDTVSVLRTRYGGHLGFLSSPFSPAGYRWMDSKIVEWVREFYSIRQFALNAHNPYKIMD